MSLENPFAMHKQAFWEAHAGNRHLALATTIVDKETGEIRVPRADEVSRAIKVAIENGFLSTQSNVRCLVVPEWAISGGVLGRPSQVCKLQGRRS